MAAEDNIDDSDDTYLNNIFHRGSDTEDSDVDEKKPENDQEEEEEEQQQQQKEEEKQHYLESIDSFVKVRILHSLGLSFQLWPAASTLVNLLDDQQPHNNINIITTTPSVLSSIFNNNNKSSSNSSSSASARRPLRILELGSGTGLVGICAAAILGSFVTLTDLPHVLPNLQFNAASNSSVVSLRGGNVNVASLRWGETEDFDSIGRDFDIILGTDVVYHDHLFDPLLQTLKFFLLNRGGGGGGGDGNENMEIVFIMAHLRRWKKDSVFFKKARKMFNVETLHTDPPSHGSRTGVVVYKFTGKTHPHPPPQVQSKSITGTHGNSAASHGLTVDRE